MKPVTFTITISPEDVASFTNLGYTPEQRHIEIAAEVFEEKVQEHFADDLFDSLLVAKGYRDEEILEQS